MWGLHPQDSIRWTDGKVPVWGCAQGLGIPPRPRGAASAYPSPEALTIAGCVNPWENSSRGEGKGGGTCQVPLGGEILPLPSFW